MGSVIQPLRRQNRLCLPEWISAMPGYELEQLHIEWNNYIPGTYCRGRFTNSVIKIMNKIFTVRLRSEV